MTAARQRAAPPGQPQAVRPSSVVRFFISLLAVALLVGAVPLATPAVRAAEGHGIKGFWVARTDVGHGRGAYWEGDFRLPDGRILLRNVRLEGDDGADVVGTVYPAQDIGTPGLVFPRNGLGEAVLVLSTVTLSAAFLMWSLVSLLLTFWRSFRRPASLG